MQVVMYGVETWMLRKAKRKKIDVFGMWCCRRVMRVSWMVKETNAWMLENIR